MLLKVLLLATQFFYPWEHRIAPPAPVVQYVCIGELWPAFCMGEPWHKAETQEFCV